MSDANSKTNDLVERWVRAKQELERAKSLVRNAECDLANSVSALGKHLAPKDAEEGERFNIWVNGERVGLQGDQMVVVTFNGDSGYSVDWRKVRRKVAATS